METFRFIFNGEIKHNFTMEQVRKNLALCFGTSENTMDLVFQGKLSFVKMSLNREVAQQYVDLFDKNGAVTYVEKEGDNENNNNTIQCPKCLKIQENSQQCQKCGVVFANSVLHQTPAHEQFSASSRNNATSSEVVKNDLTTDDQYHLFAARSKFKENKKTNKNAASVQLSISIGISLLLITFLLDTILSSGLFHIKFWLDGEAGAIDIGYMPYFFSMIFFAHAGMTYAQIKGYSSVLGAILGFTGFGLALIAILPDKISGERFELNKKVLIGSGIVIFGIIWMFSFNTGNQKTKEFLEATQKNEYRYLYFPNDTKMDQSDIEALHAISVNMVNDGFKLLNNYRIRPAQQKEILETIFKTISWQIMGFNTQRVYYAQSDRVIPEFLKADAQEKIFSEFSDIVEKNLLQLDEYNLTMVARQWLFALDTEESQQIMSAFYKLFGHIQKKRLERTLALEFQNSSYERPPSYVEIDDDFDPDRSVELSTYLDTFEYPRQIESIEEIEPGIMTIRLASDLASYYAGKTVIIAYYSYDFFDLGMPKSKVAIARIGGDIDDKHVPGEYAAFYHWPRKDPVQ